MIARNQQGAIQVPMVLITLVLVLGSLGVFGVLREWRKLVEIQLRLDRCVSKTALSLKTRLDSLEKSNLRMKVIRASLAASTVLPPAKPPLQAALTAEFLWQESQRALWVKTQMTWMAEQGCDFKRDLPLPIPTLPWLRDPPDSIGPQPLRWPVGTEKRFYLQLSHSPRHAAAILDEGKLHEKNGWFARWTYPGQLVLRTSFP